MARSPLKTSVFALLILLAVLVIVFSDMLASRLVLFEVMSQSKNHTENASSSSLTTETPDSHQNLNVNYNKVTRNNLFYAHDPSRFSAEVADCLLDKRCSFLYWHVQKTGGSYLASRLYPISNHQTYNSKEWCCNDGFMTKQFRPHARDYCDKKLGVYEVKPHHYREVLTTCQELIVENQTDVRYLALASVREPIQRTLSGIHQLCNVHSSQLEEPKRSICERCKYDNDDIEGMQLFDKIVNQTNNVNVELQQLFWDDTLDIPLYVVDNTHISSLFEGMESAITQQLRTLNIFAKNETFRFPPGKLNAEKAKKLCDFGMPSVMMKHHAAALQAYHSLWAGQED